MRTETTYRLPSRRNRVTRTGPLVTKQFTSAEDCAAEKEIYDQLAGSGLSTALLQADENRIVTEYADGPLLFNELEAGLRDPDRQSELFDLFFKWSAQFYRRTGLVLGDSSFRNFILRDGHLCGVDFESCRQGVPAEDLAWQAAMLATLRPPFAPERIRCARRFLARAPESIYGEPGEILSFLPKAFRMICDRRKVSLDAQSYRQIESTLEVAACVLAGGRSSRMGTDKRALSYHEASFLDTAQYTVELYFDNYLSLSAEDPMVAPPGFTILRDTVGAAGPIGGISRALHAARQPWILFLPCDMPLLNASLLDELIRHRREDADAFLFSERGELRTFPLLLRAAAAAPVFESALARGDLKLIRVLKTYLRMETIEATDCDAFQKDSLSNINTMEDYERLQNSARRKYFLSTFVTRRT
ncbi:MAG: NTP transferase domain-containing protein [Eubacteriales bacterium]|nr:NTP transferase domain-containing protein [Eubacteriales bacterium]